MGDTSLKEASPFLEFKKGISKFDPDYLKKLKQNVSVDMYYKQLQNMNDVNRAMNTQVLQDMQTLKASEKGMYSGSAVIGMQNESLRQLRSKNEELHHNIRLRDKEILNTMDYAQYQDTVISYATQYFIILVVSIVIIGTAYATGFISLTMMEISLFIIIVGFGAFYAYKSNSAGIQTQSAHIQKNVDTGLQTIGTELANTSKNMQQALDNFLQNQCAFRNNL